MIPDPVTSELARRLPWSYDDVHHWLAILAALETPPERAVALLEACAERGYHPTRVIASALRTALA